MKPTPTSDRLEQVVDSTNALHSLECVLQQAIPLVSQANKEAATIDPEVQHLTHRAYDSLLLAVTEVKAARAALIEEFKEIEAARERLKNNGV